jgi:hypothetical protein
MRRALVLPLLLAATVSRAEETTPASAAPPSEAAVAQSAPPAAPDPARAPEATPPAPLRARTNDELPPLKVSGYVQGRFNQGFDHDGKLARSGTGAAMTTASAFSVARARVRTSGDLVQGIGYAVEGEFANVGPTLTDGFARVTLVPYHEIRIGQQKTQFGYENPESSTRLLVVNRSLVSNALGREQNGANATASGATRDIGVGVLGRIPVARSITLEWAGGFVNGAGPNRTTDDAIAPQKDFWGRIGPAVKVGVASVRVGASLGRGYDVATTPPGTTGEPYRYLFRRVGADVQLDTPWFFAAGEYVRGTNALRPTEQVAAGAYLYAYGKTPWNLGPVARVEGFDPDRDKPGDLQRRWTLGGYYDFKPIKARVVLNYELDHSLVRRDDALLVQTQLVF